MTELREDSEPEAPLEDLLREEAERPTIKVEDKRHWARADAGSDEAGSVETSPFPTIVDEFRRRAEAAERQLHDYISAFKQAQAETDQVRERLARDVDRRVDLKFGSLVTEMLETVDHLDLALGHALGVPGAEALARGVALARDQFLATLERHGVERLDPHGSEFDPNVAEALRVDPVDDPLRDGTVTETVRPGYKLGDRVIRPARVAVGRFQG